MTEIQSLTSEQKRQSGANMTRRLARNANLLALVIAIVTFSIVSPVFLSGANLRDVLVQVSPLAVVAVPMALVIICGYLDLSVGSVLAVSAVVAGQLMVQEIAWPVAAIAGVGTGALLGLLNGFAVSWLGFSTIIVTLGTMTAARGLALVIGPRPLFGFPEAFNDIATSEIVGLPYLVLIALCVFLIGLVVVYAMPFGRHIYACGVNRRAAFLAGINIKMTGLLVFLASGAAAGLAGVMYASRFGSTPANSLGSGFEVDVLTAVLIGGVAFQGGRGSLIGVGIGVLFLGVLSNGLILMNVSTSWSLLIRGLVLVGAALVVHLSSRVDR